MNTMKDLRREVQQRLHETLDGKEIDMLEGPTPRLPHMLGITSIGAIHTRHTEDGTLLDPSSEFWQDYEEEINTKGKAERKIESAVRSLKEDNLFRMTYPHGEEADIVYCEVEPVDGQTDDDNILKSPCPKCGTTLHTSPTLELNTGSGHIKLSVNCDDCGFAGVYETHLQRR